MTGTASGGLAGRYHVAGGQRTHYLDVPGGEPPLVLLHGLSANAHEFGGLTAAGLSPAHRVIAPDLRGRGRSDKPAGGYRMSDHASDVIALLDALDLDRVVLAGHSFGGFLAIYLAAHHPQRVARLIVIDAALQLHPRAAELLKPSLDRLGRTSPSVDAYIAELRAAPFLQGQWDDAIEGYYRAEIGHEADGSVRSMTSAAAIAQAMDGLRQEPWPELVRQVAQPALLINAVGPYGPVGSPPLIREEDARATASAFRDCRYAKVPGNHFTMVFGDGAAAVRREIAHFLQ